MKFAQFTRSIVDSIADAGENFLDLSGFRGSPTQDLLDLSMDLISHKGMASGLALARQVVARYGNLAPRNKLKFLLSLNRLMASDMEDIKEAALQFADSPGEEALLALSKKIDSPRNTLFNRMIMAPDGTQAMISLREDVLKLMPAHPELKTIERELKSLLTSWFNPGLLLLQKIDWDTEASILEKIIQYEAVHDIRNWDDLKQRLSPKRRCFAFFHPSLADEPLIFVEIALTRGIATSIQAIISEGAKTSSSPNAAIFYSINNCQPGLRKIPLGNFLIKMVVNKLAAELPGIKTYSTLSPIPGFRIWLDERRSQGKLDFLNPSESETLKLLDDEAWPREAKKCKILEKPLTKACAYYLIKEKKYDRPMNPVARFHFGNGAQLYQINWMGNISEHGMQESYGLMVNYLYDLKQIEPNHEDYAERGILATSKSVRTVLAGKG